jgi:hypothetical protein
MARINLIIKYGLTKRATELREQRTSFDKIAVILSDESGYSITDSSVQRYFAAKEEKLKIAVSKEEQLQAKVTEGEIDALQARKEIIEGLLAIAKAAEKPLEKVQAFKEANTAVDSYQKSLGKFSPDSQINNNIFLGSLDELSDAELEEIIRHDKTEGD